MIVLGLALPSLKTEIHTGSYWHTSIEHLAQLIPSYLGWDNVFRVKHQKTTIFGKHQNHPKSTPVKNDFLAAFWIQNPCAPYWNNNTLSPSSSGISGRYSATLLQSLTTCGYAKSNHKHPRENPRGNHHRNARLPSYIGLMVEKRSR